MVNKQAYNFVEYDEKTDTHFIRLTGDSPKYTIDQRITFMTASEDMYEALKEALRLLKVDEPIALVRLIPIYKALAKAEGGE